MSFFLTAFFIIISILLIVVVMLQSGHAGDIASAFGGMGSQTAFGPRGAQTALGKATIVLAVLFLVTSITLAILSAGNKPNSKSILGAAPLPTTTTTQQHKPQPKK
ncbi:MAG: preprotein translocase subunit SecG [Terriglobales bacterium]